MQKRRSRHDDVREACVREAMSIIGEHGLEALSLREVARQLGISPWAPYKHFPTRDHLVAEIVSRAYADFASKLDEHQRSANPLQDLETLGQAYLDYARQHPLHYKLMFGTPLPNPSEHPEMMEKARHAFAMLRSVIARLPGERTPAQADLDALYAWSTVHGLASILETRAGEQAGFDPEILQRSSGHLLRCICASLAARTERSVS
jgi:AcrR family transcriptional regulator